MGYLRSVSTPSYELFYWPQIQGRGEFIRLVLEDAGASYTDVGREPGGAARIEELLAGKRTGLAPFALPVLVDGKVVVSQTVAITSYLGEQHGLAPADEAGKQAALAIALTIADTVSEIHDTHHPIAVDQAYETQKPEAAARARQFRTKRLPKFLAFLERNLARNQAGVLVGDTVTYVDLAAFQLLEGLDYAFPNAMARPECDAPKLRALRDRIAARPQIARYLASSERPAFNESGIFRHYPELDAAGDERA